MSGPGLITLWLVIRFFSGMLSELYRRIKKYLSGNSEEGKGRKALLNTVFRVFGPVLGLVIIVRVGRLLKIYLSMKKMAFSEFQRCLERVSSVVLIELFEAYSVF